MSNQNWSPIQCAYFAGLFEGEGCFNIRINHPKKKPEASHYMGRICITNTNKQMIDWIFENFGGNFHLRKRHPKFKPVYHWSISGPAMEKCIHAIYPYLICKRPHADTMIKFRSTFDPNRTSRMEIPEHIKEIRSDCIKELHILNHRGTLSPCPLSPSALR
jgi:LAGLIDADG DNA endonuclease family protein